MPNPNKTIVDYDNAVVKKNYPRKTLIAPVEVSPAEAAHVAGTQLIYNDALYNVLTDIAIGDTLTTEGAGANISSADDITAQIRNLTTENEALTNKLNGEIETRARVSAHNFLVFDKSKVIDGNTSGTWASNVYTINGGTITLSDIGEIVVNGTFTAQTDFAYTKRTTSDLILALGDYKLVGGISDNISVAGNTTRNGAYNNLGADTGDGLPFTITSDDAGVGIFVRVLAGTYNNVKVSPMITAPNDFATIFTPYAMTNRELTDNLLGNYVFLGTKSLSVTADGVKTIQTLLNDLKLSFDSYLESNSDIYAYPKGVNLSTFRLAACSTGAVDGVFHNTTHGTVACSDVSISSTTYSLAYCKLHTTLSSCLYCLCENGTITVKNTDVLTSGDQIRLYFEQYKIIQ